MGRHEEEIRGLLAIGLLVVVLLPFVEVDSLRGLDMAAALALYGVGAVCGAGVVAVMRER